MPIALRDLARTKQDTQDLRDVERLMLVGHISVSVRDHLLVVSGRKNERNAARPQRFGHREDHVVAQPDIEHGAIEMAAMLYQIQRPLDGVCWTYGLDAQLGKLACNPLGQQILILHHKDAATGDTGWEGD